jgi:hypothetical protein
MSGASLQGALVVAALLAACEVPDPPVPAPGPTTAPITSPSGGLAGALDPGGNVAKRLLNGWDPISPDPASESLGPPGPTSRYAILVHGAAAWRRYLGPAIGDDWKKLQIDWTKSVVAIAYGAPDAGYGTIPRVDSLRREGDVTRLVVGFDRKEEGSDASSLPWAVFALPREQVGPTVELSFVATPGAAPTPGPVQHQR